MRRPGHHGQRSFDRSRLILTNEPIFRGAPILALPPAFIRDGFCGRAHKYPRIDCELAPEIAIRGPTFRVTRKGKRPLPGPSFSLSAASISRIFFTFPATSLAAPPIVGQYISCCSGAGLIFCSGDVVCFLGKEFMGFLIMPH